MAEYSGFFDAHLEGGSYDREYVAEDFAKYFSNFVGNGIFGGNLDELIVRQQEVATMNIAVSSGQAFINGYRYENDDELVLSIGTADGILNRIDAIVIRLSSIDRAIRLAVKKGTPAASPSSPILQRDVDYYELKIAEVYIKAGATSILQTDITDTRSDSEVCGFVKTIADKDLVTLDAKVNELAKNTVAGRSDVAYPGCYYRILEGSKIEWLNPPMLFGMEFRTFERFENKPVYIKTVKTASLPNNSFAMIDLNAEMTKIVSISGFATNKAGDHYQFPITHGSASTVAAGIGNIVASTTPSDSFFMVYTSKDMSVFEAYFTVKYTKD